MKKQYFKKLTLKKSSISYLTQNTLQGGNFTDIPLCVTRVNTICITACNPERPCERYSLRDCTR